MCNGAKMTTRFVLISDTHGHRPSLPEGDILLHAGDHTMLGKRKETEAAMEWLGVQATRFKSVAIVGGNHDWFLYHLSREAGVDATRAFVHKYGANILYLENELGSLPLNDGGNVMIYGSPVQPEFCDWAWNESRGEQIRATWDCIPTFGVDILMTHGPAHGILDWVGRDRVGCEDLKAAMYRVAPKLHVFGHIHCAYGKGRMFCDGNQTTESYNAAVCGEAQGYDSYPLDPKHKPWVVDYDGTKFVEAQP